MSRPPEFRRFSREDINLDDPNWIGSFLNTLNLYLEQSYSLFNGNLTVGDNVTGQILEATFTTPSTYGVGTAFTAVNLPWPLLTNARIVSIGYIRLFSAPSTILTNSMTLQWTQPDADTIRLDYVSGLTASTKYKIRVLAL
jgi:hypothetical protein